jgi:hypothetical protein
MLHGQFPGRILHSARDACRELPKELVGEQHMYSDSIEETQQLQFRGRVMQLLSDITDLTPKRSHPQADLTPKRSHHSHPP